MANAEFTGRKARRSEPLVWIKRIVIYDSLDPLHVLRSIDLHPGLNIIWGIETIQPGGKFDPGHGVGKTTFCRLLRYCLGETSFGQAHVVSEIRHTFPTAHVAAEIRVADKTWCVLRPLSDAKSFAQEGSTIEELIQEKPKNSYPTFTANLAQVCLSGIRTDSILSGGGTLLWDHVLALCSRDQEARYDKFWNWRQKRSDSGTPKLTKLDASLCVRALLGILPEKESVLRRQLQTQTQQLSQGEQSLTQKRSEPAFQVRELRRKLSQFGVDEALDGNIDTTEVLGLPSFVAGRAAALEDERKKLEEKLPQVERQISLAAASLLEPAELQAQEAVAADVTETGNADLLRDIRELRELQQELTDATTALCKYGQILIGNCDYAKAQLRQVESELREAQRRDLPETTRREQVAAALASRASRRSELVKGLREKLDALNKQRDDIMNASRTKTETINKLNVALQQLQQWHAIASGNTNNTEVAQLVIDQAELTANIAKTKASLKELLVAQNKQAKELRQTFETLVQHTLSNDYNGRVEVSDEGMTFKACRGNSLSGEAFDTLSVLLADLALLKMGAAGKAGHPGLLIHDSPREADLGEQIYDRFLSLASALEGELAKDGSAPVQYIVTTTTPPPEPLQKDSHRLGSDNGPLFTKQLEPPPTEKPVLLDEQPGLFEEEEEWGE